MNELRKVTFLDRIKRAVKAFKGEKVGSLEYGVNIKRCKECEYYNAPEVLYLCDHKECEACTNIDCDHTRNIRHARNFKRRMDLDHVCWIEENPEMTDDEPCTNSVQTMYGREEASE